MRTFIAVNFDDGIKEKILEVRNRLKSVFLLQRVKWEEKSKFHITLQFLGETDENKAAEIISALENISTGFDKIFIAAENVDAFPNMFRAKVLFLGLKDVDGRLTQLAKEVSDRLIDLGFSPDKKFHSHITLGRVKEFGKINDAEHLKSIRSDYQCEVKSFEFMKSTLKPSGSEYEVIRSFPLK